MKEWKMACHESSALLEGFFAGTAVGLGMLALGMAFMTIAYRRLIRKANPLPVYNIKQVD
jgi:hypothetical protein